METTDRIEDLLEEVIEETKKTDNENEIVEEDNLDDLLEEEEIEYQDYSEDDDEENLEGFIPQTIDISGEIKLDEVNLEEYLKNTYSFKETQQKTFEEYKKEELEKKDIKAIYNLYNKGEKLNGFDTFDDFLKYKRTNHVFFITIGLPFEKTLFDIETKLFICKTFTSADYLRMIKEVPEADTDFSLFNRYLISSCVLYPEILNEEVDNLELGIQDVLIPALMKHSRLNTNYDIQRL